ncbi:MAG: BioY family transporter [Thermoplasmata archaeon]|nr:BioY family transporter [Thermoplasmata archaeon]|tara:strand:- start:1970 stop:2584 length:615 start_codon:yes stop_codon:yes gene_type:complete
MFSGVAWGKPQQWHLDLSSNSLTILERIITVIFFSGLTALCAQIAFSVPWTPVPYTFQTFAVLATGVYLRRNDAFASGCLYLLVGALGAPVFAAGGDHLFSNGSLIASGGYLIAFPIASALVAEGLDRSRKEGVVDFKAQMICWISAMVPVYLLGTLWLAESYSVDFAQAFEWGVKPFLIWDFVKILIMALITTKVWTYSSKQD